MDSITRRIESVEKSDTENFVELVEIAGLNPATDFKFKNLREVDFSGCDLGKFNFRGSDLSGSVFHGAKIGGLIFDPTKENIEAVKSSDDYDELLLNGKIPFHLRYSDFSELFDLSIINLEIDKIEFRRIVMESIKKVTKSSTPYEKIIEKLNENGLSVDLKKWMRNKSNLLRLKRSNREYIYLIYWMYLNRNNNSECSHEVEFISNKIFGKSIQDTYNERVEILDYFKKTSDHKNIPF